MRSTECVRRLSWRRRRRWRRRRQLFNFVEVCRMCNANTRSVARTERAQSLTRRRHRQQLCWRRCELITGLNRPVSRSTVTPSSTRKTNLMTHNMHMHRTLLCLLCTRRFEWCLAEDEPSPRSRGASLPRPPAPHEQTRATPHGHWHCVGGGRHVRYIWRRRGRCPHGDWLRAGLRHARPATICS